MPVPQPQCSFRPASASAPCPRIKVNRPWFERLMEWNGKMMKRDFHRFFYISMGLKFTLGLLNSAGTSKTCFQNQCCGPSSRGFLSWGLSLRGLEGLSCKACELGRPGRVLAINPRRKKTRAAPQSRGNHRGRNRLNISDIMENSLVI